jgi:hypothetical protein
MPDRYRYFSLYISKVRVNIFREEKLFLLSLNPSYVAFWTVR